MATTSSLLLEKFLCSAGLDVFTEPVSFPCGHNFCRAYSKPKPQSRATADFPCDICSEVKENAVKSCLVYLVSFCKVHLELHLRVTFICVLCLKIDHKSHSVVSLEEEYKAAMANIQRMKQSWYEKMAEIEISFVVIQKEAGKEREVSAQVFTDLTRSIQKRQIEFIEVIEKRHRAAKSSQLEQLPLSEDHHHFLLSSAVRGAVTLLKQGVNEIMGNIPEIKMKRMRKHAVDLTLDPDTAYCSLVISQDGKQMTDRGTQQTPPYIPKRFAVCPEVLAKEGFTTGKSEFEVQVEGKTIWIVGVAREPIDIKNYVVFFKKWILEGNRDGTNSAPIFTSTPIPQAH
uniref:B30.2/SPRY domain-containing protein n=1 Tax=Monopterus albus TaxID=43700 RepID=A0A3Q3JGE7_MONAL